jgi:hypothetical protein
MNTADRKLMQQALDALENSVDLVREDAYNAEKLYGNYPSRQGKVAGLKVLADDHEKAITAINEALAQPEQEPDPIGDAQDRLIAELAAQPEPLPAAAQPDRVRELKCVIADLTAECKELRAAQPTMFGPMGTVGALFDKHVIGRLDKNWRVYVEKT